MGRVSSWKARRESLAARAGEAPGAEAATSVFERVRSSGANLLAGGLAYRFFFWLVSVGAVGWAISSFWADSEPADLESTARSFGLTATAAAAFRDAVDVGTTPRCVFLVGGTILTVVRDGSRQRQVPLFRSSVGCAGAEGPAAPTRCSFLHRSGDRCHARRGRRLSGRNRRATRSAAELCGPPRVLRRGHELRVRPAAACPRGDAPRPPSGGRAARTGHVGDQRLDRRVPRATTRPRGWGLRRVRDVDRDPALALRLRDAHHERRVPQREAVGAAAAAALAAATSSRRTFVSSWTKIWIVAASGTAVSAPSTPSSDPKSVTATMMKKPESCTALPCTFGVITLFSSCW